MEDRSEVATEEIKTHLDCFLFIYLFIYFFKEYFNVL